MHICMCVSINQSINQNVYFATKLNKIIRFTYKFQHGYKKGGPKGIKNPAKKGHQITDYIRKLMVAFKERL